MRMLALALTVWVAVFCEPGYTCTKYTYTVDAAPGEIVHHLVMFEAESASQDSYRVFDTVGGGTFTVVPENEFMCLDVVIE